MDKREPRNGYVIVSVELPGDIADLLAEHSHEFAAIIEALGRECRALPSSAEVRAENQRRHEQKIQELREVAEKRGRLGFRLFRRYGGGKGVAKQVDLLDRIALELGISAKLVELDIIRFKRSLEAKVRKRRGREIERYYWAGKSNGEIAFRLCTHRNTVSKYISEVIKPAGRRS
jgi:hypothetical protein